MIIYSGWGPLSPLFLALMWGIGSVITLNIFGDSKYGVIFAFLLASFLTYKLGKWIKYRNPKTQINEETGEEETYYTKHSLWYIPFEYWGIIGGVLGGAALIFSIVLDINPELKGKIDESAKEAKEIVDKNDLDRALKDCDNGDADECSNAGYEYGKGIIVPKDTFVAINLFKKACDGNSGIGCRNLGVMYQQQDKSPVDETEIFNIFKKSCDLKYDAGCADLSSLYINGTGVEVDVETGKKIAEETCEKGEKYGCSTLGDFYSLDIDENQKDLVKALDYYTKGCDYGSGYSCGQVAQAYYNGDGTAPDELKKFEYRKKACDLDIQDDGDNCYIVGLEYGIGKVTKKDLIKMTEYFKKACDEGNEEACAEVKTNSKI